MVRTEGGPNASMAAAFIVAFFSTRLLGVMASRRRSFALGRAPAFDIVSSLLILLLLFRSRRTELQPCSALHSSRHWKPPCVILKKSGVHLSITRSMARFLRFIGRGRILRLDVVGNGVNRVVKRLPRFPARLLAAQDGGWQTQCQRCVIEFRFQVPGQFDA